MMERDMFVKQYEPLLYQWILNEHNGFTIEAYLLGKGFKRILIYGAGIIGECLFHVLKDSDVEIVGFIDEEKSKEMTSIHNINVYSPQSLPTVDTFDVVIVSVGHLYYSISHIIKNMYGDIILISIEDIVYGIWGESYDF